MEITWYGHSCFRLRAKEGAVVTDPFDRSIGYSLPRTTADIVTISHNHPGHNNADAIKGDPHVINGPGEYEVKGIFVFGIPTFHDKRKGRDRGRNTVYLIEAENLSVCHLGDLGHMPNQAQVEELSQVDVLLIPVGGTSTLSPAVAVEVINLIEPRIVIPMHYRTPYVKMKLDPVDAFLKEMGVKPDPQDSLKVQAGSLPADTQVVLLGVKGSG
jgi:L-ascorbate metabolism protein UlaG (beta-lactamase superfamily)